MNDLELRLQMHDPTNALPARSVKRKDEDQVESELGHEQRDASKGRKSERGVEPPPTFLS